MLYIFYLYLCTRLFLCIILKSTYLWTSFRIIVYVCLSSFQIKTLRNRRYFKMSGFIINVSRICLYSRRHFIQCNAAMTWFGLYIMWELNKKSSNWIHCGTSRFNLFFFSPGVMIPAQIFVRIFSNVALCNVATQFLDLENCGIGIVAPCCSQNLYFTF